MARHELVEERLTHSVIGAFFEVYNTLGFGFLEHIYVMALERELIARKHRVGREVAVRVFYKGPEARFYRVIHRNKKTNPSKSAKSASSG